jgi:hypothetical protein
MVQGNITPEHSFEEVNMLLSPDSTLNVMEELLRGIDDEEAHLLNDQEGPDNHGMKLAEFKLPIAQETSRIWICSKKILVQTLRAKGCPVTNFIKPEESVWMEMQIQHMQQAEKNTKLLPRHPSTAPGKYTYILEETIGDHTCETELDDQLKGILTTEMKE